MLPIILTVNVLFFLSGWILAMCHCRKVVKREMRSIKPWSAEYSEARAIYHQLGGTEKIFPKGKLIKDAIRNS